ncbi:acyl-ACP--UDP-N-acetylglucosamine O-acyltransferase [Thiofaba sp. EF100]|jgi:UDP-N-acetylglucosamine acyltransferase|uniref:acyl-ACP--UDP-N-acetylglucosamine O-acyltransferase n=1 Tax=Thiofaba sp. EF100 TaxID=3121274 RepID=UPI003221E9EF
MIDPRAVIHPKARIGEQVSIGPFSVIGAEVEIGEGTWIGPHVVINGPTRIGRDNRIFQFASIGEAPQDLKYAGEPTRLEIGDRNTIREGSTIHRGTTQGEGVTVIGSDNLFMATTHVAHDCRIGSHVIMANCASLAGHVVVEDWAILSGFSVVHQFCRIGAHSFAGGATKITQDIPPFVMVDGARARAIGINKNGLKRRNFSEETIRELHRAFKLVIRNRPTKENWDEAEEMAATCPEVRQFLDFIRASQRGIVR